MFTVLEEHPKWTADKKEVDCYVEKRGVGLEPVIINSWSRQKLEYFIDRWERVFGKELDGKLRGFTLPDRIDVGDDDDDDTSDDDVLSDHDFVTDTRPKKVSWSDRQDCDRFCSVKKAVSCLWSRGMVLLCVKRMLYGKELIPWQPEMLVDTDRSSVIPPTALRVLIFIAWRGDYADNGQADYAVQGSEPYGWVMQQAAWSPPKNTDQVNERIQLEDFRGKVDSASKRITVHSTFVESLTDVVSERHFKQYRDVGFDPSMDVGEKDIVKFNKLRYDKKKTIDNAEISDYVQEAAFCWCLQYRCRVTLINSDFKLMVLKNGFAWKIELIMLFKVLNQWVDDATSCLVAS
ncbi:hypothetical protein OSB04_027383 [Centaurea solstitialis]|uniref:Uncharacterized protein n=1 Tax=Centaurea solstitialis TaxID=347529 RepID=A0AA38VWM7_9ASTR|nr:hypothetical protein OSB04_027383 [Centaurea solstitialis]